MKLVPVVELDLTDTAERIDRACRDVGFFAIRLPDGLADRKPRLLALAAEFFALPEHEKAAVAMPLAGSAWRGWFPLGGELTSGVPDRKEGYYFGTELPPDPRPMHGPNLWPARPPELAAAVTEWMTAMEQLGQQLLALMAVGLGRRADFFVGGLTASPTSLFRIFRYPPHPESDTSTWGVGEHTDYGLLTLLATEGTPGLEVNVQGQWHDAPSDPDLVICNLGDMLDRLTGGRYRSTPHRARNHAGHDRYSLPFFLDPGWDAAVEPMEFDDGWVTPATTHARWDRADLTEVSGTYGDWLGAKVRRVFPELS
jgi:isopenicillin N synthase-like dioxygenase